MCFCSVKLGQFGLVDLILRPTGARVCSVWYSVEFGLTEGIYMCMSTSTEEDMVVDRGLVEPTGYVERARRARIC